MTFANLKQSLTRFKWRGLRTIKGDQDGVSAVEFALVAPVLVLLYFGGIELSLLMQADRRITTVTSTIGDLASRATVLDNNDIGNIFAASNQLLLPLNSAEAQMRLTNLISAADGKITVDWSDDCNSTTLSALSPGATVSIPAGILPPSSSIIMAELEYSYTSTLNYLPAANGQTLKDRFFLRPRRTERIERDNTGPAPCTT